MSPEVYAPPVRECPECGGRGTTRSQGWTGEVNHVQCHPIRDGCGFSFDVDHSGEGSAQSDEVAELRAQVETLQDKLQGSDEAAEEGA